MTFRVNGAQQTKREIDAAIARARDLTPVLNVAADATKTLINDAFDGGHSPEATATFGFNLRLADLADH